MDFANIVLCMTSFLFVWLFAQNMSMFFSATTCRIDIKFSPSVTTHVECCNDNYDVIGHVVCQPCWKNGKTLDLYLYDVTIADVERYIQSVGKFSRVI